MDTSDELVSTSHQSQCTERHSGELRTTLIRQYTIKRTQNTIPNYFFFKIKSYISNELLENKNYNNKQSFQDQELNSKQSSKKNKKTTVSDNLFKINDCNIKQVFEAKKLLTSNKSLNKRFQHSQTNKNPEDRTVCRVL